jgi:hypothetical protein
MRFIDMHLSCTVMPERLRVKSWGPPMKSGVKGSKPAAALKVPELNLSAIAIVG